MTDRVGQKLGNYRLLHLLGRGGFAEVYLGEHLYLKRRAALKVLHASLGGEDVGQFLTEAQTLARLDHPNIVRVHEFAVERGTPFLVMDHAPGGTLRHRHLRGSRPSLATTVAYVKQIASALQYAHNHHVIHRDIKPENMLFGPGQQVMLSDFGIALFSPTPEQLSTQAMMVGTIPYMAPEQIRGKPSFASDQYALGIVVYEWLCGVRPFEGAPLQIVYQQVDVPPPRLRQQNPSLPQAVEDVVLKALAKDPRERYASVELFAQALEQAISDLPFEPRNPYKGLRAFTQADAADFFGRDTLIQELLDRVKAASTSNARLLTVIGPSGSGKSSVVMAGLLPRLQQGALPASQHWVYLEPMLPGTHPLEALALTLAPHFPNRSLKSIREDLEDVSARGLHLLATRLVQAPAQKVVLLIDQFEELFALATSEQERQHFINLLIAAMTEPCGPVIVLLTLRADCYERPLAYPALCRLMEGHQKLVLPMEMADLRAVIMRPAALPDVQLSFEGDLVNGLLSEVQGQAGALPLLQFTLEQLFARRSGHTLTLAAYREIGGVKGALARNAESIYAALPSEAHRKLARALFLRLIDPGFTEHDTTRRRAALTELSLPDPAQTKLLHETAAAFIAARLLTTNEIAGTTTVEVSHEALIREWPRLSTWLREAREDIRLQQTIAKDVVEWQRRKKPADRLYRGSQLKEARTWAKRNIPSSNEVAFLQASALNRVRFVVSLVAVFLLVVSSTGIAGWYYLHQPPKPPDPTRVTNLQDDNDRIGSLSWAIINAPSGSTITFDPGLRGTIVLTSDLVITRKGLSIRGPGARLLTLSSNRHQIVVSPGASISISDLAFKGSSNPNSNSLLINQGTLTLTNSTISDNTVSTHTQDPISSPHGGGIDNQGTLTLTNSTVADNTVSTQNQISSPNGGGILNSGTLTLINSTVSHNTAPSGSGGGILNNGGTLTLTNSTVSGNTVSGGFGSGGGIFNDGGTLTLTNSTVSGNTVSGQDSGGGGIFNGGTLTLINSTVADNTASGQDNSGGGIVISNGSKADITFCTIYGNKAASNGGGLFIQSDGQVSISNSIIAGNYAHSGQDISGKLTSDGYNLIQSFSGATFAPNKQHHTDLSGDKFPNLGIAPALRDNGGLAKPHTFTLALLPGSPAIDKIPLAACHVNGIATDQRGMKRPDDNENTCDIGAYESAT